MSAITPAQVWAALAEVPDPEIPVISVVDLGVIRSVAVTAGGVTIDMAPTFAGCPALEVMREAVAARVRQLGAEPVTVNVVLSPPWTTDHITPAGREKLRAFGLAPPQPHGGLIQLILDDRAACPYCGATTTTLKNSFGPTLCRAIYFCEACRQPFEKFKGL